MIKYFKSPTLIIAFCSLLYIIHSLLFQSWIIDDAGISFTYSRNLAEGFGLVSQHGVEPVEGYSNFLWVLIFVPFFLLNTFDPIITPKLVSIILVIITFILILKTLKLITRRYLFGSFIVLFLLAINTSFVIWTSSGLENSLYISLIILLFYLLLKLSAISEIPKKSVLLISIIVSLIAMTRPDGILYFIVFPIFILLQQRLTKKSIRQPIIDILWYGSIVVLLFGSFILFRYLYFGDIFPNTYYAKIETGPVGLFKLNANTFVKLYSLFHSIFSLIGGLSIIYLIAVTTYLITLKKFTLQHLLLLIMTIISIGIFVILPGDWMGEFRFATPAIILIYIYLYVVTNLMLLNSKSEALQNKIVISVLIICLLAGSLFIFSRRSIRFSENLPIRFGDVTDLDWYEQYFQKLGIIEGSALIPDVGGALYYSKHRVYDLGGLTDKVIARTILKDRTRFHNYVFEEKKPIFIHTHGIWTEITKFDEDDRFRRDYIPITEFATNTIKNGECKKVYFGDYIRKDAIEDKFEAFEKLCLEIQ